MKRSVLLMLFWCSASALWSAEKELPSPVKERWEVHDAKAQRDFPAMALDREGTPWIAFIKHDGKADELRLLRKGKDRLELATVVSTPGIVHQPAIAIAADGAVWCFWGQVDKRDVVTLRARRYFNGNLDNEITLAKSAGSDTFADARTDHAGRVWVVWQSLRRGQADVFTRRLDPKSGKWSVEIRVSRPEGGNWEPRVAFDGRDGAWVAFDSSRGPDRKFNLFLAHVSLDGRVEEKQLTNSPDHEARASIAAANDGTTLWIAAERGHERWGKQVRGHEPFNGLNAQKRILLGRYDIATGKFTEIEVPQGGRFAPRPAAEVNLPVVAVDAYDNPCLAWRYYFQTNWRIAVSRLDAASNSWAQPREVPESTFCQDRRAAFALDGQTMWMCWPSDLRTSKEVQHSGVFLAQLKDDWKPFEESEMKLMARESKPFLNPPSPDRPRDQHHTWEVGGKKYTLVFGDLHRHTDFSNCITPEDSCTLEHFRYAYDVAGLDFMGTSDHTDIAKIYDPYEWWQTQRTVDVFYTPGRFNSLYAYEREQVYPWGHRNVVFAQRGGPVVYIQRKHFQKSPWGVLYPVGAGGGKEITPMELWSVLVKYGQPVAVISHTGATAMGTDWDKYERIDGRVENTVEVYQGARVSYEGLGAPQPTVGLHVGQPYTADTASKAVIPAPPAAINDFGKIRDNGVYQHALADGLKLGVFASSDHISTHTAFGGVYVEENSRRGIVEGLRLRHSIAATDKIFVEFSCNGRPMGDVFDATGEPEIKFAVGGTAPLKRLTLVRNETNYKTWEPGKSQFSEAFTDPAPLAGENRYYLRVEQTDGSMAWSSPVWVTVKR